MIYTLFIWTTVAAFGQGTGAYGTKQFKDWRSLTTVEAMYGHESNEATMKAKCEAVAQQLALKTESYRCVRTK